LGISVNQGEDKLVLGGDTRLHLFSVCVGCLECFGLRKVASDNSCVCEEGYYEDPSTLDCLPCLRKCKTCINAFECQSCHDGVGLEQNSPECSCDVGGVVEPTE
jgi:hypothetical protein